MTPKMGLDELGETFIERVKSLIKILTAARQTLAKTVIESEGANLFSGALAQRNGDAGFLLRQAFEHGAKAGSMNTTSFILTALVEIVQIEEPDYLPPIYVLGPNGEELEPPVAHAPNIEFRPEDLN